MDGKKYRLERKLISDLTVGDYIILDNELWNINEIDITDKDVHLVLSSIMDGFLDEFILYSFQTVLVATELDASCRSSGVTAATAMPPIVISDVLSSVVELSVHQQFNAAYCEDE